MPRKEAHTQPARLDQRAPRESRCTRCQALTRTGRYNALPLVLDRPALSDSGELLALMLGLRTWLVDGGHVYRRHADALRQEPYPKSGGIFREHRCGTPAPSGSELRPTPAPRTEPGF